MPYRARTKINCYLNSTKTSATQNTATIRHMCVESSSSSVDENRFRLFCHLQNTCKQFFFFWVLKIRKSRWCMCVVMNKNNKKEMWVKLKIVCVFFFLKKHDRKNPDSFLKTKEAVLLMNVKKKRLLF